MHRNAVKVFLKNVHYLKNSKENILTDGTVESMMTEEHERKEFWRRWAEAWCYVITRPRGFFFTMPISGGFDEPLIFALVMFCFTALIQFILSLIIGGAKIQGILITIPLHIIGLFIGAGIIHLFVLLFGGRKGFEATFRVMAYSQAIIIFNFIPLIGIIAVPIWGIVLAYIGIKRAHEISTEKAIGAVLTPYGVMIILLILAVMSMRNLAGDNSDAKIKSPAEQIERENEAEDVDLFDR